MTKMSAWEWLAILATIGALIYYFSVDFSWQSALLAAFMITAGFLSADMLYGLWFGRR
jgi:cytochrome c oxidase subunit IV